ncbi:MAG: aldehyde dehydrogenase EutE [Candidatus Muiribacterium halophilum]|uniref:Aldehyde dehydrogenase EutE n=1 Tax=Muiribacterium halophilum TaxID=2053465 RepID=A0A2N5ZBQ5_MUIH1|nr:MAG: aldehyde dehydrogenase EutE [Candidatus Muirbacterium halophilum]
MSISERDIKEIIEEVVKKVAVTDKYTSSSVMTPNIPSSNGATVGKGIFVSMEDAVNAAFYAQKDYVQVSVEKRKEIITAVRKKMLDYCEELSKEAVAESGIGRVPDRIQKTLLAINKTPGVEDIEPYAYTGDKGMTLVEAAPFGLIASITPTTNPVETIINNTISMISGGNSVVYNPHPRAKKVCCKAISLINEAIVSVGGPANLITTVESPTIETGTFMMKHPKVRLIVVTGGPGVVKAAFDCGKKVIAAGPGNPPVVVDETADIRQAAKDIVDGASFDNNVLCIAEKEVVAVKEIYRQLVDEMQKHGAYLLTEEGQKRLAGIILTQDGHVNSKFVGKDASYILKQIDINVSDDIRLIIAETDSKHPFAVEELLMPVIPIIRADNVDEAIEMAYELEHNHFHTAMMHSKNVENLHKMAKRSNVSIFVKNAPSYAGLGFNGEGPTTFTISSPTGEGITTARTFTRMRRCVLAGYFRIV